MKIKKVLVVFILISFVVAFNLLNSASSKESAHKFHSPEEIKVLSEALLHSPIGAGEYFLPSSSCRGCHGYDSAHNANITEDGSDVNLVDRWESSMMALSAKDPLWRAKVSHEILVNPSHSNELQNKCTSCHAPLGHYTSKYHGNANFGMQELIADTLALDGVSCGACHAISPNVGFTFSGDIPYDTNHKEYGPFTNPFTAPMQLYEGLTPVYSTHTDKAKICSSCHTLITETADLSGNLTGGYFTEQATYHEYLNSNFPANNINCQSCHMPKVADPIIIANGYSGLQPRTPFNQHSFEGANVFMLNLIKNNKDSLDVKVTDIKFDSTIAATTAMLRSKSINLDVQVESITADTAFFKVKIENKAGHKFPSGYPSRRAVLQFVVTDGSNDTVFKSGTFNEQFRVIGENPSFETHHNTIIQSDIPQIYEMVMGDVNFQFTSVLERAAHLLKDNRIPPSGFSTTAAVYDTVKISDDAINDSDFNKTGTVEGSGTDYIHFHVPLTVGSSSLNVKAKVYYQSVPPKWLDELFTFNSPEINKFKAMYENADQTPVLIASDSLNNVLLPTGFSIEKKQNDIKVWPTLSADGKVFITSDASQLIRCVTVYNTEGKLQSQLFNTGFQASMTLILPISRGVYYINIETETKVILKKVVRL
ncbi:MAG: T9SS type A sorting domain-containing protein [Bacteroidota bacterium]